MHSRLLVDESASPFLARLRRLTQLGEQELALIERACGPARQVRAKAEILHEGEHPGRLHVLLDGWACRFKLLPDGRRQIAGLVLPGDVCDLDGLYAQKSDYGVATLTACTVVSIDREVLRDLAAQHAAISQAIGLLLVIDNGMLTERNASLGRRSAREHLAHFLCELLIRLTLVGRARGNGYTLPITQEDISDVLGLTSVHVNRVLQGLRNEGLIQQRGHDLVICEWSTLRKVATFQTIYLHLENVEESAFDVEQAPWALQTARKNQIGFDARG